MILFRKVKFLDFALQRAAADLENRGRLRSVAAGVLKCATNGFLLDFRHRHPWLDGGLRFGVIGNVRREIAYLDRWFHRQNNHAF